MTLRLEGLSLRGRLKEVSLTLERGKVTALAGPNGAGKTSLLLAACGLLAPCSGAVTLDGAPLSSLSARERARRLGYLPQQGEIYLGLAAQEAIALGRLPHEGVANANHPAVRDAAEATGVMAFMTRNLHTLSAGERQRVLLARALATQPGFLLADEPTAALDPRLQLDILSLLRRKAEEGMGIVLALHDLTLALRFCDRVAVLSAGRILAFDAPPLALSDAVLKEAFGIRAIRGEENGVPYLLPASI